MSSSRGVLAIGGALGALVIAASALASRESANARASSEYAEAERTALQARTRAAWIAARARPSDGAEARVRAWASAVEADATWGDARAALAEAHAARARELDASDPGAASAERGAAVRAADEAVAHGAGTRAFFIKAVALDDLGDHARARDAFFEAARTATWEDAFVRHEALAEVALHDARWRDAIDESSRALDENPNANDAQALHERAFAALEEER